MSELGSLLRERYELSVRIQRVVTPFLQRLIDKAESNPDGVKIAIKRCVDGNLTADEFINRMQILHQNPSLFETKANEIRKMVAAIRHSRAVLEESS